MLVLSGADLVLPAGVKSSGTVVVEGERIVEIGSNGRALRGAEVVDLRGLILMPGFVDVHVHGIEGIDTLDGDRAVGAMAAALVKYGVTAFCPTTVACPPQALRTVLRGVADRRSAPGGARVLSAHLESNFINPDYCGAQPIACLRSASGLLAGQQPARRESDGFDGHDVLREIDAAGDAVGIVTLAPELDGAIDLIRHLVARGRRVSLGHSGASAEQARAAIDAGASQATHLFNRMPPLGHREPGLCGAVLASDAVAAEVICDGVHLHRDIVRMTVAAKGASRVMAVTDGVAAAGLGEGAAASLGGRRIRVRNGAAYLEDGTLAGSVATMNRVAKFLVDEAGLSLPDAARLTASTPAAQLGFAHMGAISVGGLADFVVLDRQFTVRQTYVGGRLVYQSGGS